MTTTPASSRRTVYTGGMVLTPAHPAATALCVDGATLTWVGPDDGATPYLDGADEVVDLAGHLVTPTFVDAHVHLSQTGLRLDGLDLSAARSRDQLLHLLAAHVRAHPTGTVLGFGWDETGWPDPTPPTMAELDRAAPGRVVYLARVDVHSGLVSSAVLDADPAITRTDGWDGTGRVERDAHHRARDVAQAALTRGQLRDALTRALDAAARAGLGCVHEMAAPHLNPPDDLAVLDEVRAERPTVEVVTYWGEHAAAGGVERAAALGCRGAAGDLCVDGAFGSRTAALEAPYADQPSHAGHLYLDADAVADHLVACTRAGLQGGFHCIGDAATRTVVDGFRIAEKRLGTDRLTAARHRLEHVELVNPDQIGRLASYGVVVSGQPAFDAAWGGTDGMYARRLGSRRALAANPWSAFLRAGVALAFGSDSPVTPFDPWGGVRAAASHHDTGARIPVPAAFEAHTRGGWYAAGRDDAGVLRPGARASFAVWDVGGLDRPDGLLPDLDPAADLPRCLRTVVAGHPIYDSGVLEPRRSP